MRWLLFLLFCATAAPGQEVVRAYGAIALALPLSEAVPTLRTERNIELVLYSGGGTDVGLTALGNRATQIALCSRALTPTDRAEFPGIQFNEIPVGTQMLVLAVSRDVFVGGVRILSAEQMRGIYEGRITNWQQVGGPDLRIRLLMHEQGRGVWELFAQWLYGEIKKAPLWTGETMRNFQEARNLLEFTAGGCAVLPPALIDSRYHFALSISGSKGQVIQPTVANAVEGKYPLSRPLVMVTAGRPAGGARVVVDFMTGEKGQELIKRHGYVGLEEMKAAKGK